MSRSEKAVELQGNPQPKYRNKNLKLVAMINGDTQQSNPVINIDLGRLTKEVEKIRETKPENVAVQEDKSALHMRKETPDENLTASVIPSKDKTAGEPVDTTNDCVNAKHVISMREFSSWCNSVTKTPQFCPLSVFFSKLRVLLSKQEEGYLMMSIYSGEMNDQLSQK